ncbi:MAG: hypothetical protein LKE64_09355 [Solobacterium sp.]|jgi:hypothetical protein|nr:hypothetical protein [Solobacterium sp.]MCH4048569.1 hypothetical protein [Solobacterium sp.]MCH4074581.1 hypothetical protein [Solobacterium sp.]MCI1314732.1 hypothetical protein [Solobacterium sp.]MCI1347101.1 hypothetical protein [Solobacterium sp.]
MIPGILYYQIVSALILDVIMIGVSLLSSALMSSIGHKAVTNGDFKAAAVSWL